MPGRDILGNDALVAPAAFDPRCRVIFVFYSGRDRRFVQEKQDQSIKRGSSVKELGAGATQPTARKAAMGGYLPLAAGVSTVRYPIPQRTFKYVATVQSVTDETCQELTFTRTPPDRRSRL
jgi:hypothetical protein